MQSNIHLEFLRQILLPMPAVTEKPCYGTPGFYVGKKMFARMKEDEETLVVHSFEREIWMEKDPDTFFVTDHYLDNYYVLVSLPKVAPEDLVSLLLRAWTNRATAQLIKVFHENLKII